MPDTGNPAGNVAQRKLSCLPLILVAGLLSIACTAPGMKMNMKPGPNGTSTRMGDLNIMLHPLGPEVLAAQNSRTPDPPAIDELLSSKPSPYLIGTQDILLVTVWDHPEITLPMVTNRGDNLLGSVVDEDGFLFFPYAGKVLVKGKTTTQVRDELASRLAQQFRNPQVDVKVIAYRSQKVYVGGEVRNPAIYNVTDVPFTLAEAVNRAGGFLPSADDSRILLTRGDRTWRLNFHALMNTGNRIGQILLNDGDSLHIPNNQESPIYMMGELMRPGNVSLQHGNLSLAQAITECGGIQSASADARSIYVIRQADKPNSVDVYHLDARNPTAMVLADRFALRTRDIVYVDAGTLVRFNRVMSMLTPTISTIAQTGLSAAEIDFRMR